MKTLLKFEEVAQFAFGIMLFSTMDYSWWVFPALILTPDIGMIGYLVSPSTGAATYNLFHHKGIALVMLIIGMWLAIPELQLVGIILFSHAAMDRIFGYGLKYADSFNNTHLGKIGKE